MIPSFPEFKKIELSDITDVEKITQKYPPYADFNFSNLWSWDLRGEMGLSLLNNNLVVKFTDYLSNQKFLSFLGCNMVNETARDLIIFSENNYKKSFLKLIPEVVVDHLDKSEFDVIFDRDSSDYIYSVSDLANLNSRSEKNFRKGIRQFIKKFPNYSIKYNTILEISANDYIELFKKWAQNKNADYSEFNEYKAFERILKIKNDNIKVVSLYIEDKLAGFTLFEQTFDGGVMSHFAKADTSFSSAIYSVLNWEEAKILNNNSIRHCNWQQDLGLNGMRISKTKYNPIFFLEKFFVSKKK